MFTCPKCKTTWSKASDTCTCGERVLDIPDELKERVYLIYNVSGYDEVVKYLKNCGVKSEESIEALTEILVHKGNDPGGAERIAKENYMRQKLEEAKRKRETLKQDKLNLEKILKSKEQQEKRAIELAKKEELRRIWEYEDRYEAERLEKENKIRGKNRVKILIALVAALGVVLVYLITPMAAFFISKFLPCDVAVNNWSFVEYLKFWGSLFITSVLLLSAVGYLIWLIFEVAKGNITIREDRSNRSKWMLGGALLYSSRRNSGLSDAATGAVVGAVAHHSYNALLEVMRVFILLIPVILAYKASESMFCGREVQKNSERVVASEPIKAVQEKEVKVVATPADADDSAIPGSVVFDKNNFRIPKILNKFLFSNGYKNFNNLNFVIHEDFSGDGIVDYVFFNEDPEYCGTHGCSLEVLVSSRDGYVKAFEWKARRIRLDGGVGGKRNLILDVHGNECDLAGYEACQKMLIWHDGVLNYQ